MTPFSGFPAHMSFTPIPNIFFSEIMPEIDDTLELKVILVVLALLYRRKGHPKYINLAELEADPVMVSNVGNKGRDYLETCLDRAVSKKIFIKAISGDGEPIYLLNSEANVLAIDKIRGIKSAIMPKAAIAEAETEDDIFALYEENIGLLTPLVCDELAAAEQIYPKSWIKEAITEAVSLNKRSWRYISRILENWATQGKDGTFKRNTEEDGDKYTRGKYGHVVKS